MSDDRSDDMSENYKTHSNIYQVLKDIDMSRTELAKIIGISRVTLYKSINSFRDMGVCANRKCLLLFTELIKEQKNHAIFVELKVEKINSLFENVDFVKQKIEPKTKELINETMIMLRCLLNDDLENGNIDKTLRFIARNFNRNYDGNIILEDISGFQTITNKNILNALMNRCKKLRKEIETRDYMGSLITDYKQAHFNYNKNNYKQGQLITGWIAEIRETGCVIKFSQGNGFIETKYILKSDYKGNLNEGQKVNVRIRKLDDRMIQFMEIKYL